MNHWTLITASDAPWNEPIEDEVRYAVSRRPKIDSSGIYQPSCVMRFTYSLSEAEALLQVLGDDYFIDEY